jgi:PAS domain S-box-containing protein
VARVTLVVIAVAALFAGCVAVLTREIVQDRFAGVERDLVMRNRAVLARVVGAEVESLATTATDWAQWDDLYDFARGKNTAFAATELGERGLDRLRLDLVLLVDGDGHVLHRDLVGTLRDAGRQPDLAIVGALARPGGLLGTRAARLARPGGVHGAGAAVPATPDGGHGPGAAATVAGLLDSDSGPLVLAARRITRTDGSGEPPGVLVLARRLDPKRLSAELSVLPSTVLLLGSVSGPPDDRSHALAAALFREPDGARLDLRDEDMSDFQLFRDFNGDPAFLLEIRMERPVWLAGIETTRLLLTIAGVGTVLALLTLILVFRQIVTGPINRLTRHVLALRYTSPGGRGGQMPCRDQGDEIGTLAREFGALVAARDADAVELARLAAAVDHAADAIAVLDRYGHIAYVNARYEEQTGYRADEVVGRPPGRAIGMEQPYTELWQTVRSGEVWSGLIETTRRNGHAATEEVTVAPIRDAEGEITSYVAVLRDVTARRAAEAELRKLAAIAEHAAESIAVLDATGVVEYVNPAFERQRGRRLADVIGTRPGDNEQGLDDPALYASIWATVRAGDSWSGRLNVRLRDGRTLTEDAVLSPVRDARGKVTNIVVILHDVTARVQLEGQLARAHKLEAVGRLAAGVAHEINTPIHYVGENVHFLVQSFACLGTLLGDVAQLVDEAGDGGVPATVLRQLLADAEVDYLRAEIPQALRQSLDGIDRVTDIVHSMKELANPAQDLVITDVNPVVRSAVTMAAAQCRGVAEVQLDLAPDLPGIPCVPGGLNQALVSMLVNAAEAITAARFAGGARRGTIRVSTCRSGDGVEIVVADDGAGMPDHVRERVFDPFYTTKPEGQGTGQGLAVAHSLVQRLGGEIRVESEPGRGATFTIRLPGGPACLPLAEAVEEAAGA